VEQTSASSAPRCCCRRQRWIADNRDEATGERSTQSRGSVRGSIAAHHHDCANACPKHLNPAKAIARSEEDGRAAGVGLRELYLSAIERPSRLRGCLRLHHEGAPDDRPHELAGPLTTRAPRHSTSRRSLRLGYGIAMEVTPERSGGASYVGFGMMIASPYFWLAPSQGPQEPYPRRLRGQGPAPRSMLSFAPRSQPAQRTMAPGPAGALHPSYYAPSCSTPDGPQRRGRLPHAGVRLCALPQCRAMPTR